MFIDESLLKLIISLVDVTYAGCHCPNNAEPLYGKAAYWRIYDKDGMYLSKITSPVPEMEPSEYDLSILFEAELRRRFEAIHERCTTDNYGKIEVISCDPYRIKPVLRLIEGKYYRDLKEKV